MVKRYYSFGEIFAAIIVIVVVVVTAYRMAVIFDWLPEDFKPTEIALTEYKDFKVFLMQKTMAPGAVGSSARGILHVFADIEKYIKDKQEEERLDALLPEECRSGSIFRFFMFMSNPVDKKYGCTRENLRLKNALDDANNINHEVKPQKAAPAPAPAPNQVKTPTLTPEQQNEILQKEMQQYQPATQVPSTPAAAPATQ